MHDHDWARAAPLGFGLGGPLFAWFVGHLADVSWTDWFAVTVMLASGLGGLAINLWRRWQLARIEVMERRRQATELPVEKLDPDAVQRAGSAAISPSDECAAASETKMR